MNLPRAIREIERLGVLNDCDPYPPLSCTRTLAVLSSTVNDCTGYKIAVLSSNVNDCTGYKIVVLSSNVNDCTGYKIAVLSSNVNDCTDYKIGLPQQEHVFKDHFFGVGDGGWMTSPLHSNFPFYQDRSRQRTDGAERKCTTGQPKHPSMRTADR